MLTHKPTQYGLWEPSAPSEVFAWWFFMQQYGLAYGGVWAKGKTSLLTSAPIVKAMELWLTQYKNIEPQGTTAPQSLRLMGNGTVAETQTVSAAAMALSTLPLSISVRGVAGLARSAFSSRSRNGSWAELIF